MLSNISMLLYATRDYPAIEQYMHHNLFSAPPNVTFTPPNGYVLSQNTSSEVEEFELDCSAVLDPKVKSADVHWRTNHTELESQRITQKHPLGIKVSEKRCAMYNCIQLSIFEHLAKLEQFYQLWGSVTMQLLYFQRAMIVHN